MKIIKRLFRSRKFLLILVALIQSVFFAVWTDFPDAVWQAIDGLLMLVVGTIAVIDVKWGSNKPAAFDTFTVLRTLIMSRKFWLAVLGCAGTIVLEIFGVSQELWLMIDGLLAYLIITIAVEDAGEASRLSG